MPPELPSKSPFQGIPQADRYIQMDGEKASYKPTSELRDYLAVNIFSQVFAFIASGFGFRASEAAKTIRDTTVTITTNLQDKNLAQKVRQVASLLRGGVADVSASEAHQVAEEIVLALYNRGDDKLLLEEFANWRTHGTPREGVLWRSAYDRLAKRAEHTSEERALLLQYAKERWSFDRTKLEKEKARLARPVLQDNIESAIAAKRAQVEAHQTRMDEHLMKLYAQLPENQEIKNYLMTPITDERERKSILKKIDDMLKRLTIPKTLYVEIETYWMVQGTKVAEEQKALGRLVEARERVSGATDLKGLWKKLLAEESGAEIREKLLVGYQAFTGEIPEKIRPAAGRFETGR